MKKTKIVIAFLLAICFIFSFQIPAQAKIKTPKIYSITEKKGTFTVKYLRKSVKSTGYQLQFATNKAFTKNVGSFYRNQKVGTGKYISSKVEGCIPKTRYYFRLRAFNEKSGKRTYSSWCKSWNKKTSSFTDKLETSYFQKGKLFYMDDKYPNTQGLCTDGRKYIYMALRSGANTPEADADKTMLRKIDKDGKVVAQNNGVSYCHANGMAYCGKDKRLYIATLGRKTNQTSKKSAQDFNVIGVADSATLKNIKFIYLQKEMKKAEEGPVWSTQGYGNGRPAVNEEMPCPKISTVAYDALRDQFVCTVTPYRLQEGSAPTYRGLVFFNHNWQFIRYLRFSNGSNVYTGNAIPYDGGYLICREQKDNKTKILTLLDSFCGSAGSSCLNATTGGEFECAGFIGDTLYGSFNMGGRAGIQAFKFKPGKDFELSD